MTVRIPVHPNLTTTCNRRNIRLAGILEAHSLDVHAEETKVIDDEEEAVKEVVSTKANSNSDHKCHILN